VSRIFLSHSSANNAEAIALSKWLESHGWDDLFLDLDPERGLKAGERWQAALKRAASRCELVIFLVSPAWAASKWCLAELLLAKNLNKRIFGVIIEPTPLADLPTEMTAEWQVADLTAGARDYRVTITLPASEKTALVAFAKGGLDRLRIGLMQAGLDARYFAWPPTSDPERAPYRGLRPLEAEDAGIFFGRDGSIIAGLDLLRGLREIEAPRVLVILGASGAGKSSFMRAGLVPRLAREDQHFLVLPVIRPERAVLSGEAGLIASLTKALKDAGLARTLADTRAAVAAGISGIALLLATLVDSRTEARAVDIGEVRKPPTLIVPVDQAEELFLADGAEEAHTFLQILRDLAAGDMPALIVVFTIRTDSYERLQTAKELAGIRQHTLSLPAMPQGAYADVIKGPARRLEGSDRALKIEELLVDALLSDIETGDAKDALPLLAFTLERLYREFGGDGDLKLSEYEQLGRVKGSIEAAVERALKAADDDPAIPKDRATRLSLLRRALIPWLAGIDPETGSPRRRIARLSEIPVETRPLVALLVEQRLLATDVAKDTGEKTIEPSHEALLRQWGLLRGWLAEDAGLLAVLDGVKWASRDWTANGQAGAWLMHSAERLKTAERLTHRADLAASLERTDHNYLAACRAAERSARGRTRRVQGLIGVLIVGMVAGLVGWFNQSRLMEGQYWLSNVRGHGLTAEAERALQPGATFWECAKSEKNYSYYCPEMVIVPGGEFSMGSTPEEIVALRQRFPSYSTRFDSERPRRKVTITRAFAVSKFAVTFDQWDACVAHGGCTPAGDAGWGRGKRPVINVNLNDVQQFVAWFAKLIGQPYRLLSEAEWEYAARAGTATAYPWGEEIGKFNANCRDCGSQWDRQRTAPVGSFEANAFGLHDMHGNVWQWVEDKWHENYQGAPLDGSVRLGGNASLGSLRGGSWNDDSWTLRSANRERNYATIRFFNVGFRLARTLVSRP
jgi:formylglycine-generating enzyme required for sulfatase activity